MLRERRPLLTALSQSHYEHAVTVFVTPLESFVTRASGLEAPVRVALSSPVGSRELIDGAVYEHSR